MMLEVPERRNRMNRTETYSGYREGQKDKSRVMKDADAWVGNSLATILGGLAVASGILGLLVAFGYINDDATNSFQDGMVWLISGIILAIAGNVFRREHHVVDSDTNRSLGTRPLSGGSEGRMYDRSSFDDIEHEQEPGLKDSGTEGDVRTRSESTRDDILHRSDREGPKG
jgi:hypothetical protein